MLAARREIVPAAMPRDQSGRHSHTRSRRSIAINAIVQLLDHLIRAHPKLILAGSITPHWEQYSQATSDR
jgi:hypothetical protein